ncbi:MAG TPA: MFS transporter, partial [Methanocorpusculum sp.]|nr:MFS transporter [Methanocorpusculum sp.]
SRIVEHMPDGEEGTGSSLMITTLYLGVVVGIALYAAVFTALTSDAGFILSFADLDQSVFMYGFHITNAIGLFIAAAALILSFIVKDPAKKRS